LIILIYGFGLQTLKLFLTIRANIKIKTTNL
jgi:hypothetical protein